MPNIQAAYDWAIETCVAPNVGYSQTYRNQQTVGGITYYDCSSFIWFALIAGGFDVVSIWGNWPFTTSTMASTLKRLGFIKYSPTVLWKPADILIKTGHCEMAFDVTRSMGAHTDRTELELQVSINSNDSRLGWLELWRWEEGASTEWIKGNRFLTMGEMQNNASLVFKHLMDNGWTANSVSGVLGNMQAESSVNPAIWQNLDSTHPEPWGYGLVQWTPSTNWGNWAAENGYAFDDGTGQLEWIDKNTVPFGQWIPTAAYPETFIEFKISTFPPEYLADAFLKNFERPADQDQPIRQQYARYWFNWYNDDYVPPTNPPNNGGQWSPSMPVYFYLKNF